MPIHDSVTDALPKGVFESLIERTPYAMTITNLADGRIHYANAQARRSLNFDPTGCTAVDVGYWEAPADRMRHLEKVLASGVYQQRIDYDEKGERGAEVLSSVVVTLDGVDYLLSMLVDITAEHDMELELADARHRLERAQEMAAVGDFITDLDSDQFNGSLECMRLLGFRPGVRTVSVRELFDGFHPDDVDDVRAAIRASRETGSFTVEHRLKGDDERWVHTRGSVETLPDGKRIMRGTAQDVTERKQAERERERLQRKMQETQKLESLGLLSGGVAHDFNNLLAGILGNADLALLNTDLPPEVTRQLRDIVTAAHRAAELTRQLLAYSGRGRFVVEPTDLSGLTREMADLLKVTVEKNHALELNLQDDLPAVEADATQIRQVVMNLLINASESIQHDRGMIRVTSRVEHRDGSVADAIVASTEINAGTYVLLEVADNGSGMSRETMARVFDPFFTTKFTGRGLGMAAVLGIVRGHNGAIEVRSFEGHGSTFRVLLPASDRRVPATSRRPDAERKRSGAGGVLVIDDEQTVRHFVCNVLRRAGYTVFSADGGVQGAAAFAEHAREIDIVLLDLTMPDMDGVQTCQLLQEQRSDVQVVLMSGYDEQDALQRFRANDVVGFLPKPFLVDDLLTELERAASPANLSRT